MPKYKLNPDDINEINLRIKYIYPIFKYFFSHKKHGLVLHYPEKSPDERKLRTDTIKRPDAIVSFYQQSTRLHNAAFFEIKTAQYKSRTRILMVDLYKLVHYGKDALDACVFTPILFQVIGFEVTVYMQTLETKGFYAMFKVCTLKLPSTTFEIADFIDEVDKIAKLSSVLLKNKETVPEYVVKEMKIVSYGTPEVQRIVEQVTFKDKINFTF